MAKKINREALSPTKIENLLKRLDKVQETDETTEDCIKEAIEVIHAQDDYIDWLETIIMENNFHFDDFEEDEKMT